MRIRLVPHDPAWPGQYDAEARRITLALEPIVVRPHHIGSTAIPRIRAKPIIDILLEVDDPGRLDGESRAMEALGYEAMGEFGIPGRRYFRKSDAPGVRTHHVHAFRAGSAEVTRHLAFRDYMIAHPVAARAYCQLKRKLAQQHPDDIEAYMDGKGPFIREHEQRALAWWTSRSAAAT